ncbi:MAG TPA: DegV family protein [Dehalococcoidia bacterium]|nr:DegV family protein [Dehalococcoidia bacterium]
MSPQARVKIVTDSTSDLPAQLAQELGITVVPLHVHFGEEVYRDGIDMTTDDFYRRLTTSPTLPKTSAPSPGAFHEVYTQLAREGEAIFSIHISSNLSATYEAARLGSGGLDCPISIVDSQSASMGCGLLAIMAAKAAGEGASLEEVVELVGKAIPRTLLFGLLDTLEYLHKGGRIGKAQAFLGTMLKVKPMLAVRGGEVLPVERVRSRPKAIDRLCEMIQGFGSISEMAVLHNTTPEEAETLAQRLSPTFPQERMYRAKFGPVMGTYVGPGSLGVALVGAEG